MWPLAGQLMKLSLLIGILLVAISLINSDHWPVESSRL